MDSCRFWTLLFHSSVWVLLIATQVCTFTIHWKWQSWGFYFVWLPGWYSTAIINNIHTEQLWWYQLKLSFLPSCWFQLIWKRVSFFIFLLLTISYATMKFWWQCEDGNMRRAGWGQQHEDGCIRLAVAGWWHHNNGLMMVVLNFYWIVSFNFELMSILNSPLSQFSISIADCYRMHLNHTLKMAKGEFLFCVAS